MVMRMNRRNLMSAVPLAAGGAALGASDVLAQATPATGATPVTAPTGRNPYEFLGDLPTFTVTSTDVSDGQEMPTAQRSGIAGGVGRTFPPSCPGAVNPLES
jgi:hypothetical protein